MIPNEIDDEAHVILGFQEPWLCALGRQNRSQIGIGSRAHFTRAQNLIDLALFQFQEAIEQQVEGLGVFLGRKHLGQGEENILFQGQLG